MIFWTIFLQIIFFQFKSYAFLYDWAHLQAIFDEYVNRLGERFFTKIGLFSQPAITRSKLTIETLEQGVKYVQSNAIGIVLVSLLLLLDIFHPLF